jgi:hypothetical protein
VASTEHWQRLRDLPANLNTSYDQLLRTKYHLRKPSTNWPTPGQSQVRIDLQEKIVSLAGIRVTSSEILINAYSHTGQMRIPGSALRHPFVGRLPDKMGQG